MLFTFDLQFLSNFYMVEIKSPVDGITYPSTEHYFQAMKSDDQFEREKIAKMKYPGQAKLAGRKLKLRPGWDDGMKIRVMRYALNYKFKNESLRQRLQQTGQQKLTEGNYWHDNYWGDCYCPKCGSIQGKNMLGILLMEKRDQINKEDYL